VPALWALSIGAIFASSRQQGKIEVKIFFARATRHEVLLDAQEKRF
jgi:hypothetical protein